MNNIKIIIQKHNLKTLNNILSKKRKNKINDTPTCIFRSKNLCPFEQQSLIRNFFHKATVISNMETKEYIGSTGKTFKSS